MDWLKILAILGSLLIVWILYRGIRGNPNAFSKASFNKSLTTMGLLALILMAFITFCVLLLRSM